MFLSTGFVSLGESSSLAEWEEYGSGSPACSTPQALSSRPPLPTLPLYMEDRHLGMNLGGWLSYNKLVAKLNHQERFEETLV